MGKWTPDYLDDVLHSKLKSLVSGAITRSSLEKAEPRISYDTFVKELDAGDSFTTSLIDILVQELAERRTRSNTNDRRLIAPRTSKSLHTLASTLRTYRDRSAPRTSITRRSVNLDYLTSPPDDLDMEDEDEFASMLDPISSIEGTRINPDIYDAYDDSPIWSSLAASTTRRVSSPLSALEEPLSRPRSRSPLHTSRSGPWSMPPAASSSLVSSTLVRQPSIRRPVRSRTGDFSDFTHRRRSSAREALSVQSLITRPDGSDAPVESRDSTSWSRNPQSTRRFFPFSRTRRHESLGNPPWADVTDTLSADASDEPVSYVPVGTSPPWFPFPGPLTFASPPHDTDDSETSDERAHMGGPRLRRGGVRPPESILSRHASPVVAGTSTNPAPASPRPARADTTGYPTPGPEGEMFS